MALAPDGKIVVEDQEVQDSDSFGANDPFDVGDQTLHVIRLNADGSRDSSFNFSFTTFLATPPMVVDSQGRVLVGWRGSVIRLKSSDGSLDTSFGGGDGSVDVPSENRDIALVPGGNDA